MWKIYKFADSDSITYPNKHDYLENFYGKYWEIELGSFATWKFHINASYEQEAVDFMIDYIEENDPDLLFPSAEKIENEEEHISGGNHNRVLTFTNDEILIKQFSPKKDENGKPIIINVKKDQQGNVVPTAEESGPWIIENSDMGEVTTYLVEYDPTQTNSISDTEVKSEAQQFLSKEAAQKVIDLIHKNPDWEDINLDIVQYIDKKQEMKNALKGFDDGDSSWEDDAEVAIYYFANHYHGGQNDDLYKILSTSPYKPGPISTLDSEGEVVKMMYDALQEKYFPGTTQDKPDEEQPVTIETLKEQAVVACMSRQHDMGPWEDSETTAISYCKICGDYVKVDTNPKQEGIDVEGSAVSTNCIQITPKKQIYKDFGVRYEEDQDNPDNQNN